MENLTLMVTPFQLLGTQAGLGGFNSHGGHFHQLKSHFQYTVLGAVRLRMLVYFGRGSKEETVGHLGKGWRSKRAGFPLVWKYI